MKKTPKKLRLNRETLSHLSKDDLEGLRGAGNTVWCTELCSLIDCSLVNC